MGQHDFQCLNTVERLDTSNNGPMRTDLCIIDIEKIYLFVIVRGQYRLHVGANKGTYSSPTGKRSITSRNYWTSFRDMRVTSCTEHFFMLDCSKRDGHM